MIIPARFLKSIKRDGFGPSLFYTLRYDEQGKERPDFILNQPAYRKASILVTGTNFGCGSSREHAPWALDNFGIRCVIAPDFADIFYNNAFKNVMLLIRLPQEQIDLLTKDAANGANATFTVDLEAQEITRPDGGKIKFDIDPFKKHCLLNGLDDIGLTLQKDKKIASYEEKMKAAQPWL
jgi:3-isopropylmalate/(R)-2-methylmalate dehydratase small subunit